MYVPYVSFDVLDETLLDETSNVGYYETNSKNNTLKYCLGFFTIGMIMTGLYLIYLGYSQR
jgi:hypothetical protein